MIDGYAIVVDVGKTLAKVSLWSRDGHLLDRQTRANRRNTVDGIPRLDTAALSQWVIEAISRYAASPVRYIVPVAHGAALAAIRDNALAFEPLDYEWQMSTSAQANYRASRDAFAITGSPALPSGLNLGAQLHWLDQQGVISDAIVMPYAQYWGWLLTGIATSEVTSLGCHSDLWCPQSGGFSPMAQRRGWARQFAPLVKAGDVIGPITPQIAQKTGLSTGVKVLAGLHDSNAALLAARGFAEIEDHEATVLSTGTWFIAMRLAKSALDLAALPEARDCLINVDAYGQPVPSARFMGGREIEMLIELDTRQVDIKPDQPQLLAAVADVVKKSAMVLPTLAAGNGPFPKGPGGWINRPEDWYARRAAACLYAALVTDQALDLIGAQDRLLVEGRFAEAEVFVGALASLRPETKVYVANAHNDVSFGALRLINPALRPQGSLRQVLPLDSALEGYRAAWRAAIEAV